MKLARKVVYIIFFLLLYSHFLIAGEYEIHLDRMNFFIEMEDFQKAYGELRQVNIKKIPQEKRALFYNKAGFINYKINKIEPSLKNYFLAIKLNPNLYFVYNNIGIIYFSLKQFNKAKKYYLKALKRKNNYPRVLINLAVVNFYLKDYKSSYEWLKKALSCNREYVKKRFDNKKAIQKLKELANQNPDDKDLQKMIEWVKKNRDKDITDINFIEDLF